MLTQLQMKEAQGGHCEEQYWDCGAEGGGGGCGDGGGLGGGLQDHDGGRGGGVGELVALVVLQAEGGGVDVYVGVRGDGVAWTVVGSVPG